MKITFLTIKYLKIIAGIILLFSIFLPFSSCTHYLEETSYQNIAPQERPPIVKRVFKNPSGKIIENEYYKLENTYYVISSDGWPYIIAYIWPLIIIYLSTFSAKTKALSWSLESILAILAAGFIFWGSFLCAEIGAFLSFFSNASILLFWIIEAGLIIYLKFKYKNLTTACFQTGVTLPLHTGR